MSNSELPVIRGNGYDLERIRGCYAAWCELGFLEREQERRVKAIPGGWRDLKLCRTLLKKLADNMVRTLQPEKRESLDRTKGRMHFRTWCGTEAVNPAPNEVILLSKDMTVLLVSAHEGKCTTCFDTNCRACPLGKTLDSVLSMDRGDRLWSSIDIKEAMED